MLVFTGCSFRVATGDCSSMNVSRRGEWNDWMEVETTLSMLPVVCPSKYYDNGPGRRPAHIGWLMATFILLVQVHGRALNEIGRIRLSIAAFSLL
jgi:hypothetical protein